MNAEDDDDDDDEEAEDTEVSLNQTDAASRDTTRELPGVEDEENKENTSHESSGMDL